MMAGVHCCCFAERVVSSLYPNMHSLARFATKVELKFVQTSNTKGRFKPALRSKHWFVFTEVFHEKRFKQSIVSSQIEFDHVRKLIYKLKFDAIIK